jgi:two-component system CheB/CheR fusion protein
LCVFARHDLASDPSFSRLDLISCRNVLIYMGPALQKRVLSIFQYALKPGGFLFLGNSESIGDHSDFFTADDRIHRIFLRKLTAATFHGFSSMAEPFREPNAAPSTISVPSVAIDFRKEAETMLLEHYTPPALIVDPALHIVHFQGDISPYLAPATGQPSFHLLKMVRPELVVDLRTAIYKARREGIAVHKDAVPFDHRGQPAAVRLEVRPLRKRNGRKQDLLIVFQTVEPASLDQEPITGGIAAGKKRAPERMARLERELASAREHLRALIEEHEIAQEEMKAANEEILASNQELQSTNEELETAREELQSSNEELNTVNEELQHRNTELNVLTNDLSNLLVGVDIPVLVLDAGLRVRRFTPVAGALLNLIPGDIGRPFANIASNLNVSDWKELFSKVTDQGQLIEREVGDRNGHRYSMRVRPYKTSDNRIEGVLVVLLDTDLIYRARDEASDYARAIVETIHEALVAVDAEFRVLTVNQSFCDLFRVSPQDIARQSFFGSGAGQIGVSPLRELLQAVLSKGTDIEDFELDQHFPEIGHRRLDLNAHQINKTQTILIAIEDVTERKQLEQAAQTHAQEVQALAASLLTAQEEERRRVSRELHDEIGQQLASLAIDIGGLATDAPHPEDAPSRLRALQARVVKASEVARHIAYELHPSVLDDLGLVAALRSLCKEFSARAKNTKLEFTGTALPASLSRAVASCLYRIAQESLQNISKHADAKHIAVALTLRKGTIMLTITDNGAGFDPAAVKGRGGLGLIGMEERARLVNGKLTVSAKPGHGTRIEIEVPISAGTL